MDGNIQILFISYSCFNKNISLKAAYVFVKKARPDHFREDQPNNKLNFIAIYLIKVNVPFIAGRPFLN